LKTLGSRILALAGALNNSKRIGLMSLARIGSPSLNGYTKPHRTQGLARFFGGLQSRRSCG
jgi:hypothetical protein